MNKTKHTLIRIIEFGEPMNITKHELIAYIKGCLENEM